MRRRATVLGVLLLVCRAASAQAGTTVTLQNQENSTFYFVMDPAELSGITATSALLESEVTRYFAQEYRVFPFTSIQPKTSAELEGLGVGTHLLVGFFAMEEKTEFPVRIITIKVDTNLGKRTYDLYSEPAFLSPVRGVGKLSSFGATPSLAAVKTQGASASAAAEPASAKTVQAAEPAASPQPAAAETVTRPTEAVAAKAEETPVVLSDIADFPLAYTPALFTQEKESAFTVLPIEQAGYWNRNGTRISSLSGTVTGTAVEFELKSASGFSKNVSYFVYLFPNRNLGQENPYTIEIIPVIEGQAGGVALLWEKGGAKPAFFGTLEIEGPILHIRAELAKLPAGFLSAMGSGSSADVTSCYFDDSVKTYEEFFYATFALSTLAAATH